MAHVLPPLPPLLGMHCRISIKLHNPKFGFGKPQFTRLVDLENTLCMGEPMYDLDCAIIVLLTGQSGPWPSQQVYEYIKYIPFSTRHPFSPKSEFNRLLKKHLEGSNPTDAAKVTLYVNVEPFTANSATRLWNRIEETASPQNAQATAMAQSTWMMDIYATTITVQKLAAN